MKTWGCWKPEKGMPPVPPWSWKRGKNYVEPNVNYVLYMKDTVGFPVELSLGIMNSLMIKFGGDILKFVYSTGVELIEEN